MVNLIKTIHKFRFSASPSAHFFISVFFFSLNLSHFSLWLLLVHFCDFFKVKMTYLHHISLTLLLSLSHLLYTYYFERTEEIFVFFLAFSWFVAYYYSPWPYKHGKNTILFSIYPFPFSLTLSTRPLPWTEVTSSLTILLPCLAQERCPTDANSPETSIPHRSSGRKATFGLNGLSAKMADIEMQA